MQQHFSDIVIYFTYPSVADLLSSLLTVDWLQMKCFFAFGLSAPTICCKSNNLPSFTLTRHVYHVCLANSTQANTAVCNVLTANFDHHTAIQNYIATSWGYQQPLL